MRTFATQLRVAPIVVFDEADFDTPTYQDLWADMGVWLHSDCGKSPLPRRAEISVILSTLAGASPIFSKLDSWVIISPC